MFRFQYEYTLPDLNALSRLSAKTYRRKKTLVFRTVMALMGVAYLGMGALLLAAGSIVSGLIITVAGMLFTALWLGYHQGIAWRTMRMLVKNEDGFAVTLEENGVHGRGEKGESTYLYSAITGMYHYRERYFLFVDPRHAILLPERSLVEGDPAALPGFLREKIGKEIQEIK